MGNDFLNSLKLENWLCCDCGGTMIGGGGGGGFARVLRLLPGGGGGGGGGGVGMYVVTLLGCGIAHGRRSLPTGVMFSKRMVGTGSTWSMTGGLPAPPRPQLPHRAPRRLGATALARRLGAAARARLQSAAARARRQSAAARARRQSGPNHQRRRRRLPATPSSTRI